MTSPPLFNETWITKDNSDDVLTDAAKETLKGILSPYISAASTVSFSAADVTDVKTPFMEITNLNNSQIALIITGSSFEPASVTTIKVAVTHKTVNGRTYALAVIIGK